MIFVSPDVASSLRHWELAEYASEGFVILACAGELVADLATCLSRRQRKHIGRWSTILLVAALSVSLKCLVRTNELSGNVIGSLGDKAEDAGNKARTALTDSGIAQQKADTVAKQADTLKDRMESASRTMDRLEQDILAQGPRWRLLRNGEAKFIQALKPFTGQRVTIVVCGSDDPERFALEQLLFNLFPEAGWDKPGYARWAGCPNMLTGGNEIYFVSTASGVDGQWVKPGCGRFDISGDAGDALCDALNQLKIFTMAWREEPIPQEVGINDARLFFGNGAPDGPGEMAYKDPGRIFLLIGPSTPMFADKNKHPHKSSYN